MAAPTFSKFGFFKSYILPLFIILLIPVLGWVFYAYAERTFDNQARQSMIASIESDSEMTAEDKAQALEVAKQLPLSRIMASFNPALREMQDSIDSSVRRDYFMFRWLRRTAMLCIFIAVLATIAVGTTVALSLISQPVQYWCLRISWYILRLTCLLEVLGQGLLVASMSYWVTVILIERISLKLVLVGILGSVAAVGILIAAIFKGLPPPPTVEGKLLAEADAPELWGRVSQMAAALGIARPDSIVVGIDDNFYVTENPLQVGSKVIQGRTLFASLALLKVLSRHEADAVLAHEMAHFSGQDTVYGRKTAPLLQRYVYYLEALYEGGISRPIFYYMFFFWNLFQLSLSQVSRAREFRADGIGAQLTTPGAMAGALVKIAAYCKYRGKVQSELMATEQQLATVDISTRLATGFPEYLRTCIGGTELADASTPHPFDSHPTLERRLGALGLDPVQTLRHEGVLQPVPDTWFHSIQSAAELEAQQWKEYEEKFQKLHELTLLFRYLPEGDEQTALVVKHFPPIHFTTAKGESLDLDYRQIRISKWESAILFSTIKTVAEEESFGKKYLKITYRVPDATKDQSQKFQPAEFTGPKECEATFKEYYGRFMAAKEYALAKKY